MQSTKRIHYMIKEKNDYILRSATLTDSTNEILVIHSYFTRSFVVCNHQKKAKKYHKIKEFLSLMDAYIYFYNLIIDISKKEIIESKNFKEAWEK